jgi:phage tail-like protein
MPPFAERLRALLPDLYVYDDASGDLQTFLQLLGLTLDELQVAINGVTALASVTACSPEFLPYLAGLVGATYDPTADPTPQRWAIGEAIERYRRIGTLPGLRRDLSALGWTGDIIETATAVLRLNRRAGLNRQKLPGRSWNLGIYQVTGITPALPTSVMRLNTHATLNYDRLLGTGSPGVADPAMAAVLARHQPAGTLRIDIWQRS